MIFIYNMIDLPMNLVAKADEKNVYLVLKSAKDDDFETSPILIANKETCPALSDTVMKLYGDTEHKFLLKKGVTRIKPTLHKKYYYFDKMNTQECVEFNNTDEDSKKKYRNYPWNKVVTITSVTGKVYVDLRNTSNEEMTYDVYKTSSDVEIKTTTFCIKWVKWTKLKFPIDILISDGINTRLTASFNKKISKNGREFFENELIESSWDNTDRIPTDEELVEIKEKLKNRRNRRNNNKPYNKRTNDNKSNVTTGGGYKKPFVKRDDNQEKKSPYNKPHNSDYKPQKKSYGNVPGTKNQKKSKRFNSDFYN